MPKIRRAANKADILRLYEEKKLYDMLDILGLFGRASDDLRNDDKFF